MAEMKRQAKRQTFKSILKTVAPTNAGRLMSKARLANSIAKTATTKRTRLTAYSVKTNALLALQASFPKRVTVSLDPQYGTYFVLVKARNSRFGLHAPAHLFDERAA
jgi:hypothetical protein